MEESANIEFFVRGLFTASTGLPAELYPQLATGLLYLIKTDL